MGKGFGAHITVKAVDHGFRQLGETLKALKDGSHVKVGVLDDGGAGSEQREGSLSNAQIAAIHEFGSSDGRIPERSFIRSTFNEKRAEYVGDLKTLLLAVVKNTMTLEKALDILGAKIAADIKNRVTAGAPIPPPNAPSTAARKVGKGRGLKRGVQGPVFVRTLIDTGRMIASVTWAYVRGTGSK